MAFAQATALPPGKQCFQAVTGINGFVGTLGAITGGSGGTSGSYGGVSLIGGSGSGATANITVSSGAVTAVTILNPGQDYVVSDVLSAASGTIGGVIGFSVPIASIAINSSLAGGSVGMYIPGTFTPSPTWQNTGETILNTNPISLDSNGCALIFGSGTYRQILYDSLGNTVWDQIVASPNLNASAFSLNTQTTNYTVQSSDCGNAVQMGSGLTGSLSITFPGTTTGFASGCSVVISNGDAQRLKSVSGVAGMSWLYPQQYAGASTITLVNGAWVARNAPNRYRPNYNPTYIVDIVNGNDANDCLGTGTGACATLNGAFNVACNTLDSGGYYPTVQMTNGQTFKGNFLLQGGGGGGPGGGATDLHYQPSCLGFQQMVLDLNGANIAAINTNAIYIRGFAMFMKIVNSAGLGNGGYITTGSFGSTKGFLVDVFGGGAGFEIGDGNVTFGDVPNIYGQLLSTRSAFLWTDPNACPLNTTTAGCQNSIQVNLNQGNGCTGSAAHAVMTGGPPPATYTVTSVVVDAAGSSCVLPPYIQFVGNCSVQPAATAALSGSGIGSITVTSGGTCTGRANVQIGNAGTYAFGSIIQGIVEIEAPVIFTGSPTYTLGTVQSVENSLLTLAYSNPMLGTVHGPQYEIGFGGVLSSSGETGSLNICPGCNSYIPGDAPGWVAAGGGSFEESGTPTVSSGNITALTTGSLVGGSGGVNATYTGVPLTGGHGGGAVANVVVSGGAVTAVTLLTGGWSYQAADSLSAASANIGGVTGFSIPVTTVSTPGCGTSPTFNSGATDFEGFIVLGTSPTGTCIIQNTTLTALLCTATSNTLLEPVDVANSPPSGVGPGQAPGTMVFHIGGTPFSGQSIRWTCKPAQSTQ